MKSLPKKNSAAQPQVIATNANSGTEKLLADLNEYAFPLIQDAFAAPFAFTLGKFSRRTTLGSIGIIVLILFLNAYTIAHTQDHRDLLFFMLEIGLRMIITTPQILIYYYHHAINQAWFPPLILALFAVPVATLVAWTKPFEPVSISLGEDGISCCWKFGWLKTHKHLPWLEISNVRLLKPSGKSAPESWFVCFESASRPSDSLKIRLTGLGDFKDRQIILDALNLRALNSTRDPELLEAFTPAAAGSYTELWLQSLASPPRRDRLKPLLTGASLQNQKYVVSEQLGAGGEGVAYLATMDDSDTMVVLKESILPVYLDIDVRKAALEKFAREAEMLRQLQHPQIVQLLDFFVEDHRGYLVLEHIRGLSLRALIDSNGRMSEARALELAKQMCSILEYLHAQSPPVVHRDFTPDNLILGQNNVLKLIDFTVADQSNTLKTATVVGKPSYMPPEQLRGRPCPQSDIYAMGATVFYLLTGEEPEPITPSDPNSHEHLVSAETSALILKATAMSVEDRVQSAKDFRKILDER